MPPETFTFACPACNTRLTVPTSLAGVIGPCPSCGTRIQAPSLPAAPQVPASTPAPAPAQVPPPVEIPAQPPVLLPPPAPGPPPQAVSESKVGYRPEPRQLPSRPDGMEPVGKPVSEAMRGQPEGHARSHRGGLFFRILIPLVVIICVVGVIFGVVSYMKANQPPARKPTNLQTDSSGSTVRKIQPEDDLPLAPIEPDESTPIIPPIPEPAPNPNPKPVQIPAPSPTPPDPVDPSSSPDTKPSPTISALQILEQFLDASSLDERLPHMEGRTSREELELTCLAKPLPEHTIEPAMQSDNSLENYTDFTFKVTFPRSSGGKDSYDMLVRRRGDQDPKVVTDPFLDLFGGRLLAFATTPGENKHGVFQVLVSPNSSCSDTSVPNHDKKITLKLIATLTGKELVSAYAGKASAIGDMLENDQSGLRWGRAKPCTILLSWNTRDNPTRPYLEASSIKALSWNP